jgi:hypothetical protein
MTTRHPNKNRIEGERGLFASTIGGGAQTPEELEVMFEDALLVGETDGVARLFDSDAALVIGDELPVRDVEAIARLALATWQGTDAYVAAPRCVVQVGDIALVPAAEGINVARRSPGNVWRYVIVLCSTRNSDRRNQ